MIAFAIARIKRLLLISAPLPVTRENLQRLDAVRRYYGARAPWT